MKKIYLITDADWLKVIAKNKKELAKEFWENYKKFWYEDKLKNYIVEEIAYDWKNFDYDWGYWEFRIYEKNLTDIDNMEHIIEYDDYKDYWIICKELKKDFLYLKKY